MLFLGLLITSLSNFTLGLVFGFLNQLVALLF